MTPRERYHDELAPLAMILRERYHDELAHWR